ncbi:ATP-binding protein [Planomonospora sp. ID67723]|uniref:ATP-binding protein n=1 Tax=Planomonospora sp. ID67723 TaxID=2738134 RepID=UPI0018C40A91|nr:ATP-binding protein [Planomonospora sp. ID67723]MBG0830645.1 ATP-binding protein [Planomonospora sp. ID67723]
MVTTPLGHLVRRHAEQAVTDALADTRVVLVNGARQSGKSTLVRQLAKAGDTEWRDLDDPLTRQAALSDPSGFVDFPERMVIDEIQRAPELLLAIKSQVDANPRPGRYLLTGSSRLLALRGLPDTLPGRMETIELWPFAQGEIGGRPDGFIDAVFGRGPELRHTSQLTRADYAERLVRGGYPEAVARTNARRRQRFFDSYVGDLINRDVMQLSEIERIAELRALIKLLAARSGQLLVVQALSRDLGLPGTTTARFLALLEEVFLVKRVPAWSKNISNRAVHTPKIAFVDSGVAANLLGADARGLLRPGSAFGPLLEGFVLMELSRQTTWSDTLVELYHYRTKDKVEVDAILETRQGQVVGVEVKAASTVRPEDFKGLRHLAERVGPDFVAGLVLHTGTHTFSFGDRMLAVPVSALWETHP